MALFFDEIANFSDLSEKKCGVVSPLFSKNLPLRKARKMEKMIVFGGVCFLKKQVKTGHFFFSDKSENVAISSKKKATFRPSGQQFYCQTAS